MAVLNRTNLLSNERLDLPDYNNLELFVQDDFNALMKYIFSGSSRILTGFRLFQDNTTLNDNPTSSPIYIKLAGSVLIHSDATGVPFMYVGSPTLTPQSIALVASATNYIEMDLTNTTGAQDTRSFWDPTANNGEGAEYTQIIDTVNQLTASFTVNQVGWSGGTKIKIAKVTLTGSTITSNDDWRPLFYRLDPSADYSWPGGQTEPNPNRIVDSQAYLGGDKSITMFKEWMDAVMTEIKRLKGSSSWFSNGSSLISNLNLSNLFFDTNGSILSSAGYFAHSLSTPGNLTWSSTLFINSIFGDLAFQIPAANITLSDGQVGYINLIRNQLQTNSFTFTNGSTTVSAVAGSFTNFVVGDWIKATSHNVSTWRKISSFNTGVAATAVSVTLDANYSGATIIDTAVRTGGSYTMQVASPLSVPVSGDTFWIVKRKDNVTPFSLTISAAPLGAVRVSNITTFKTTTTHGLVPGQVIVVSGVTDTTFNGIYQIITTPASDTFTVTNTGVDATSGSGSVVNRSKIYVRGVGELDQGEIVQVSGTFPQEVLQYMGSPSQVATAPQYGASPTFISNGDSLTTASGKLDTRALSQQTIENQDKTMTLTNGGVWGFNPGTGVLSWSANANISIPGLADSVNVIAAGSVTLTSGQVAYVTINRSGSGGTIAVTAVSLASYTQGDNKVIFATLDASGNIFVGVNNTVLGTGGGKWTTSNFTGTTITPDVSGFKRFRYTAGSVQTLSSIASGNFDGQVIGILGTSDTNTIAIANSSSIWLNGDVVLGNGWFLVLQWDLTDTAWKEMHRNF